MSHIKIAQLYVDALLAHHPGASIQEINTRLRLARHSARTEALKTHAEETAQTRAQFEASERKREAYRKALLDQRDSPNHGQAFHIMVKHLQKNPEVCAHFAVAGEAAKTFHRAGELPLQPYYLVLAYPRDAGKLRPINMVGHGDDVFDGCLLAGGVMFSILTVRTNWVKRPEYAVFNQPPHRAVRVPVINRDVLDPEGQWSPKHLRKQIEDEVARVRKLGYVEG